MMADETLISPGQAEDNPYDGLTVETLGYRQLRHDVEETLPGKILLNYIRGCTTDFTAGIPDWTKWFMVSVRGGTEHDTAAMFNAINIEAWVPETTERKLIIERRGFKRPGQKRKTNVVEEKLLVFPGFVLLHLAPSAQAWHAIHAFRAVQGIYANPDAWAASQPSVRLGSAMSEKTLRRLRELQETVFDPNELEGRFAPQQTVKIIEGPLAGHSAVIQSVNAMAGLLMVEVELFGQATPASVDMDVVH